MRIKVNPQNSQKLEPAKFSCYMVSVFHLIKYIKCWHTSKSCTNHGIEVNNKVQCTRIIKSHCFFVVFSCCCCCCHHLNSLFFIVCRQTQATADWYMTCCVSFLYHYSLKNNAMTKQIIIDTYVKTALWNLGL